MPLVATGLPMNPLPLPYLQGYPPELFAQVQRLVADGRLAETVAARHPEPHAVRSERALVEYVQQLKARHLKSAPPLAKVAWDAKLQLMKHVLGTHITVARVQGRQLKAKREIRIATGTMADSPYTLAAEAYAASVADQPPLETLITPPAKTE